MFPPGREENLLVESRLFGLNRGDGLLFRINQILAVYDVHRLELVAGMDAVDLKELTQWLAKLRRPN